MISSECGRRCAAGIGGHFGSHRVSPASRATFPAVSANRRTIALNTATAAIETTIRLRLGFRLAIVVPVFRNADFPAQRLIGLDLLNRVGLVVANFRAPLPAV